MSTSPNPRSEQPSTYFVQDRQSQEEMKRLYLLDQTTTASIGGVLPEQPDPTIFRRVLDVGCGTGGWLIELAKAVPACQELVGVDASRTFVEYAREQAKAAGVNDRVEFHVGDALRMLEFPTDFFDLVNHRFAWSWLRTWDWRKLLQEYQRVARSGGMVRITEGNGWEVDTPPLSRLADLFFQAMYQSGHTFTPGASGVIGELALLLQQHGLLQVQTKAYSLQFRADSPQAQPFFENIRIGYRTTVPFMRKWTRVPDDYDEIYQQAVRSMQPPDTLATWNLLTAWGIVPPHEQEHDYAPR